MQRIVLVIEYLGTNYCGWQYQKHCNSIQQEVEQALFKVAQEKIKVFAAGRTDTGVHALCQIIHFDSNANRTNKEWLNGTNFFLPKDIRVLNALTANTNFHSRYDAISREYQYLIFNKKNSSPFLNQFTTLVYEQLDVEVMNLAAKNLIGELDFSSFRAQNCQSKSKMRNVSFANFIKKDEFLCFRIVANAFLYHMVRNIVGSLIEVGKRKYPPSWIKTLLDAKDRTLAAPTAPASGLFLTRVTYADDKLDNEIANACKERFFNQLIFEK